MGFFAPILIALVSVIAAPSAAVHTQAPIGVCVPFGPVERYAPQRLPDPPAGVTRFFSHPPPMRLCHPV